MTGWQKVQEFDKKITKYEESRTSGFAGISIGCILANIFSFALMWVPFKEIFQEIGAFWAGFQGILLFLGVYWRMQWLFGLYGNGKWVSWKEYLKYVPVDWREYRRHRYQVLFRYAGKIFFWFAVSQMAFQVLSCMFTGTAVYFGGILYAAGMCLGFVLLPGMVCIWKWC
ncbi:hypothetical protein D7V86_15705 [bacterium D16-51]|nr:hypothetical protein D7V96_15675 [bacterium D16-59]RKI58402.1 hypothetical protein D7V86_15705 [bacterium D16-51]